MKLLQVAAALLLPTISAATCDPYEILFQSNAYADSLSNGNSTFRGGSILSSQSEWDTFLTDFHPNNEGESLSRTDIDFNKEKVMIATYGTSATCQVEIDNVYLNCDADAMKIEMDVYDASIGCDVKCMAVGQVVYAIAIPMEWEVDTDDIVIDVTGPCVERSVTSSTEEVNRTVELIQNSGLDCGTGACLSSNGTCESEVSCFVDPCDVNQCEDGEVCSANYCGGCHFVCTPDNDTISEILLDTTTVATVSGIEGGNSSNIAPVPLPAPVPSDSQLCDQIRDAFDSSALSRYLLPDGTREANVTIVTSQDEMDRILSGSMPMYADNSTTELENIDFTMEQVIFAAYYNSSSCNVEITTSNYTCMTILDDSAGCEVSCDAEGPVVFAMVIPIDAAASLSVMVNGPCLESPTLDSVTMATEVAVTTSEASTTVASTTSTQLESNEPTTVNVPEGKPRDENSSSLGSLSRFVSFGTGLVLFHLSWKL